MFFSFTSVQQVGDGGWLLLLPAEGEFLGNVFLVMFLELLGQRRTWKGRSAIGQRGVREDVRPSWKDYDRAWRLKAGITS